MKLVTENEFDGAVQAGGLAKSASSLGIGRELSYSKTPARTVVVQFLDSDTVEFRCGVAERVLHVADTWYLSPRYGAVPALGLVEVNAESVAVEFSRDERQLLAEYLVTRPMVFGVPGLDLYAVASEGQALLTWDHHTQQDGLCVQLQRVQDATTLVAALCSFGSELAVFSRVWGNGDSDI